MKYVKMIKPGTSKNQLVESDRVEFYKQYGWQPDAEVKEASAVVRPVKKKTAKSEPAVEYTLAVSVDSQEEVGTDDNKGE